MRKEVLAGCGFILQSSTRTGRCGLQHACVWGRDATDYLGEAWSRVGWVVGRQVRTKWIQSGMVRDAGCRAAPEQARMIGDADSGG